MWGCYLMSGVKILHFLKDWWKSIPIHQNYTMALRSPENVKILKYKVLSSHRRYSLVVFNGLKSINTNITVTWIFN